MYFIRTPCPNCGRKFNSKAAERHIPLCKNIKAKPKVLIRGSGNAGGVNAVNSRKKLSKARRR